MSVHHVSHCTAPFRPGNSPTYIYRSKSVMVEWAEGVCQSIQSKCLELSAQAHVAFGMRVAGVSACSALLSCSVFATGWRSVALEVAFTSSGARLDTVDLRYMINRKVND